MKFAKAQSIPGGEERRYRSTVMRMSWIRGERGSREGAGPQWAARWTGVSAAWRQPGSLLRNWCLPVVSTGSEEIYNRGVMGSFVPEIQCWLQTGAGPDGTEEGDPFGGSCSVLGLGKEGRAEAWVAWAASRRWGSEEPDGGRKRYWACVLGPWVTCL